MTDTDLAISHQEQCEALSEPRSMYAGQSEAAYRRGTHSCALVAEHDGEHQCPICGNSWMVQHR